MNATTVPALVIRRIYAAPPETVFRAWTTPATLQQFLGPGDTVAENIRVDLRTGGAYRIDMRFASGDVWTVGGVYREVQPPRKLVMTWRWQEDNPADEFDTLLTLEFNPADGGTELVLTHAQLASNEQRERHGEGWNQILDTLQGVLHEVPRKGPSRS